MADPTPNPPDDLTALHQFARTGSDEAFALLVQRHVNWVYSAALRQVRNTAAAEDVTQAAFILLAQKAGTFTRETHLAAWLFKVVRYEALVLQRSERRRAARERSAAIARAEATDSQSASLWNDLAPVLDDAVAALSKPDQKSILLRFYQQMTFAQVGAAMNTSEEAARKRVDRAIIQLRRLLAVRGVNAPPETIAPAMLAAPLVHPAPPLLAASAAARAGGSATIQLAHQAQRFMRQASLKIAAAWIGMGAAIAAGIIAIAVSNPANPAPPPPNSETVAQDVPVPAAFVIPLSAQATSDAVAFTGRVLDTNGVSIAGATIWPLLQSTDNNAEHHVGPPTTSAPDGTFTIQVNDKPAQPPLPGYARSIHVIYHADGFAWSSALLVGKRPIDMELPLTARLRAVFLDPAGGPVQGVPVSIEQLRSDDGDVDAGFNPPAEIAALLQRTTDASGAVQWSDLPRDWMINLNWKDSRFGKPFDQGSATLADTADSADITVHLVPGATIRGHISYATTGAPAANVRARSFGETRNAQSVGIVNETATTDADGNYALTQLLPATYPIILDTSPYESFQNDWTAPAITGVTIASGQTITGQDFVLEKGATITGLVTDAESGKPLAGANIEVTGPARPPKAMGSQSAQTDEAGRYLLRVPPGKQVLSQGYGPPMYQPDISRANLPIALADGQTVERNFQMRPYTGQPAARSKVVFEDGAPAPGARLYLLSDNGGQSFTLADKDGQFSSDPSASYTLHARLGLLTSRAVKSRGGTVTLTLLPNLRHPLTGKVLDENGQPILGATINAWTMPGLSSPAGEKTTDAAGQFRFINRWTTYDYRLLITAEGYASIWRTVVSQNNAFAPVIYKLVPADQFIRGRVFDANGKPLANVDVSASGHSTLLHTVKTDEAGAFVLNHIARDERVSVVVRTGDKVLSQVQTTGGKDNLDIQCKEPTAPPSPE